MNPVHNSLRMFILSLLAMGFGIFFLQAPAATAATACEQNGGECVSKCNFGEIGGWGPFSDPQGCPGTSPTCCKKDPNAGKTPQPTGTSSPSGTGGAQNWGYKPPIKVFSFTELFKSILGGIQGIVGILAVIMIVFGGLVYITSGGRSGQTTWAKDIITLALVGFAVAVAAPSILKELQGLAGGSSGSAGTTGGSLKDIVIRVMNFLLVAVGLLGGIGFVIGGILYATAMGDQTKADAGKKAVYYSIMAIAISGAGVILMKQILSLLSGSAS